MCEKFLFEFSPKSVKFLTISLCCEYQRVLNIPAAIIAGLSSLATSLLELLVKELGEHLYITQQSGVRNKSSIVFILHSEKIHKFKVDLH